MDCPKCKREAELDRDRIVYWDCYDCHHCKMNYNGFRWYGQAKNGHEIVLFSWAKLGDIVYTIFGDYCIADEPLSIDEVEKYLKMKAFW